MKSSLHTRVFRTEREMGRPICSCFRSGRKKKEVNLLDLYFKNEEISRIINIPSSTGIYKSIIW